MLPVVVSSPARAASYLFPLIFPKKPKLRTSGCRHLPTPIHFSFFCWFLLPAHHHDLQCDSSFNCEDSSVQRHDSFRSWLLGPWPPLLQESFPLLCPTSASYSVCILLCATISCLFSSFLFPAVRQSSTSAPLVLSPRPPLLPLTSSHPSSPSLNFRVILIIALHTIPCLCLASSYSLGSDGAVKSCFSSVPPCFHAAVIWRKSLHHADGL